ncbi:MAG: hypothetical protein SGPRY_006709, partial [Prymnesium sp.]
LEKMSTAHAIATFGLALEFCQLVGAFLRIDIEWASPLSDFSNLLDVIMLKDFEIFSISCYLERHPAWMCLRRSTPVSRSVLFNAIGLILVTLYPTITLIVMLPLRCFDQPNGARHLVAFPEVVCSGEGIHGEMVGLMVGLIILFPVGILAMCIILVLQQHRGTRLFRLFSTGQVRVDKPMGNRSSRFLFGRWRMEHFYYQIPRLVRNFLAAAIISFISYEQAGTQILLLTLLFMLSLASQVWQRPWRIHSLNDLDAFLAIVLLVLLAVMGTATVVPPTVVLSTLTTIFLVGVVLLLLGVAGKQLRAGWRKGQYDLFLSHHKGGAGNTVRLTKLLLKRAGLRVFFDADDLLSLDLLFDAVKNSRQLVVILSGETTTRPYCVGEITVAYQNGIPILPVVLVGSSYAGVTEMNGGTSSESLWRKGEGDRDGLSGEVVGTLTAYEMREEDIVAAMAHLSRLPVLTCKDAQDTVGRIFSQKLFVHQPIDSQKVNSCSHIDKINLHGPAGKKRSKVEHVVLADFSNLEALSVATYLQLQLADKSDKETCLATPMPVGGSIQLQPEDVEIIRQHALQ